jgi:hypothetical protein
VLPFLDRKRKQNGVIVEQRSQDGSLDKAYEDDGNAPEAMEACAREILEAISAKDPKKLASALQSAFEIADSQSHVEGEHIEESEE